MLEKGKIISEVFVLCGNNSSYSDNSSDEYKVAEKLLNSVIDNIGKESSFMFNAVTIKLTKSSSQNTVTGDIRYNAPNDMLNFIKSNAPCKLEGEFFLSSSDELMIQYCRKISFTEFPDNLHDLLVSALFSKITVAFNSYNDRYQIAKTSYEDEKRKVIYQQGFNLDIFGGE